MIAAVPVPLLSSLAVDVFHPLVAGLDMAVSPRIDKNTLNY